jgi:hypothetical protein
MSLSDNQLSAFENARASMEAIGARRARQAALQDAVNEAAPERTADAFCVRLLSRIKEFEKELDVKHEVGGRLVSFGETVVIHIEQIGYLNPALIFFRGVNGEDEQVELVQHVSQISGMLIAVKALDLKKPRRVAGFAPISKDD